MQKALHLSEKVVNLSSKRFDPSIEPIAAAWKKMDHPDLQEIIEATGWEHISIQNGIFKKDHDQTKLTLGGISKGFFVDLIAETLLEMGFRDFLIQWAENIRAHGHHPNACDWVVQINPALTDTLTHFSQGSGIIWRICFPSLFFWKWGCNTFLQNLIEISKHISPNFLAEPCEKCGLNETAIIHLLNTKLKI